LMVLFHFHSLMLFYFFFLIQMYFLWIIKLFLTFFSSVLPINLHRFFFVLIWLMNLNFFFELMNYCFEVFDLSYKQLNIDYVVNLQLILMYFHLIFI
jgi:hypothetical protein